MIATNIPAASKPSRSPTDAIALLKADHDAVRALFSEYEGARSDTTRKALVAEICSALKVHAQIEEEIFYPAVRRALNDGPMAHDATVQHAGLKELIAQLEATEAGSEMYDAKVKSLSDYMKRHVKEDNNEMFNRIRSSSLHVLELGARMAARKDELLAQAA